MKVLMVCQKFPPHYLAGAETHSLAIAKATQALGVSTDVLTTSFVRGLPARETVEGVPVIRVRNAVGRALRVSQFAATFRAVLGMAKRYDVIYCQCISPASLGAAAAARLRGLPVMLRPSLGGADGEVNTMMAHDFGGILSRILAGVDLVPVLDQSIADDLDRLGIPQHRCRPVQDGVDLSRFRVPDAAEKQRLRQEYGLSEGPVALFAGQLIERKGLHDLLAIWPSVHREMPQAMLVVAGAGALQRDVEALAGRGVRYMGVSHDIARLMQAVDLMVMPSRNESFGLVYAEAMASGLPIISGATGVVSALPIDGRAGFVVDAGDKQALRARLLDVLSNPIQRSAMGAEAALLIRAYDLDVTARETTRLYEEVKCLAHKKRVAR